MFTAEQMVNRKEILRPGSTYHVYNHANGNEKLFKSRENYRFFLQRYRFFIEPVAHTFCYCLMPNHFHFLIRCKDESEVEEHFLARKTLTGFGTLSGLERQKMLSKHLGLQFSHLFNGYTQAFNKQYNRKGSLFMRPFNRIVVTDVNYLQTLVPYIHLNPVESGFCKDPSKWYYSSYKSILLQDTSFIRALEVITWFNDLENFKFIHIPKP
jgi:putative transposase